MLFIYLIQICTKQCFIKENLIMKDFIWDYNHFIQTQNKHNILNCPITIFCSNIFSEALHIAFRNVHFILKWLGPYPTPYSSVLSHTGINTKGYYNQNLSFDTSCDNIVPRVLRVLRKNLNKLLHWLAVFFGLCVCACA